MCTYKIRNLEHTGKARIALAGVVRSAALTVTDETSRAGTALSTSFSIHAADT